MRRFVTAVVACDNDCTCNGETKKTESEESNTSEESTSEIAESEEKTE